MSQLQQSMLWSFVVGLVVGAILGLLLALVIHDLHPMNYFDGQVLIDLIGSLGLADQAEMTIDLTDALGDNGNISQHEFDRLLRDAGRLKYGP